jgi:integrase
VIPTAGNDTVAEFLATWINHIAVTREPTTVRGYRAKIKRINAKLGGVRLDKLTPAILDRTYREWLAEGLAPSSVHHLHRIIAAALHQGMKWGRVSSAATDRASPPRQHRSPKTVPSPDVVRQLIAAADESQPVLAAAVALAAATGLRRGELLGLRWSDVDLTTGTLNVERAIKQAAEGRDWIVGDPKTHQRRSLALDVFSQSVLFKHRERAETWAADAQVPFNPEGYVLTIDPTGNEPTKPDSLGQAFGRLCAKTGRNGLTLHSLRHFAATYLVASGVDVRTVAGRLGHSDPSLTLRIYSAAVTERDRHAAGVLGSLLAG